MPDPQPDNAPAVKGLPPGAIVKPLSSSPAQIKGLPPGAVVKPISKPNETPKPEPPKPQTESYAPTWWGRVKQKYHASALSEVTARGIGSAFKEVISHPFETLTGADAPSVAAGKSEMLQRAAGEGSPIAQQALDVEKTSQSPLVDVSGSKYFQRAFDPKSRNVASRGVTGAVKGVEGLTSPQNIQLLATLPFAPEGLGGLISSVFGVQMAQGAVSSGKEAVAAAAHGESGDAAEKAVESIFNAWMAHASASHALGGEPVAAQDHLADTAKNLYKKPFADLTDQQKAHVLYDSLENADPHFRARVDSEVEKLQKSKTAEQAKAEGIEDKAKADAERLQAAKTVLARELLRQHRAEQFKIEQAQSEARAREAQKRQQYDAQKADEVKPREETTPVKVEDRRSNTRGERGYITGTEKENYPVHAPGTAPEESDASVLPKVNDQRPLSKELVPVQRASELERPVQEYAEEKMGASFSSLPLDRQKVVARYFERFQPEKWDAFKGTQAYDAFRRHADISASAEPVWERYMDRHEGSGETLQPGADANVGLARLLIGQTDLPSTLKAAPAIAKSLNEYSEQNFGPSFEVLPAEDKAAALGGFLRDHPEHADAFMSSDVAERVKKGQAIDLANMEADLRDKQQVETLMKYRDQTRAAMDTEFAGEAIRQQREEHTDAVRGKIREAQTQETAVGERLVEASRGLAKLAESINLDNVNESKDMFHIERLIRQTAPADRSAAMIEYLAQAQRVRLAAEDQVVQEYRESLARELRTIGEAEAPQRAAREVLKLEDQRAILNRQADHLGGENATPEQKAEAQDLRDTASFVHRKEDAVVAANAIVQGRTATPVGAKAPAIVGRDAFVVLESGERVPVHYAVMESKDLIPSHETFTYAPDSRFPAEAQPRDYQSEKALQAGVEQRAGNLDAGQILSDTSLPIDGPPIVRSDGVVIGGNGRTQSMKLAIARGEGEEYSSIRQTLFDKAAQFGIPQESLVEAKEPVLVRVMDKDPSTYDELVKYGLQFNRDPSHGMSESEQQIAFSRLMTPEVVRSLAGVMESLPEGASIRTAMRERAGDIRKILEEGGFVATNKMQEFFADGDLTERAKGLVENTLAGLTVTNAGVVERASAGTRDRLARVGVEFLRLATAGDKWAIASPNTDAVDLLTRAEDQAATLNLMRRPGERADREGSLVERMLHPERFVNVTANFAFDGQPTHAPVNPVVEALALALEEKPREYAALIHRYVRAAVEEGTNIFGARSPEETFTETIGAKFGVDVIHDEWGMVGALPETVKAQIEEARGPMPVEPAVHAEIREADIAPDSAAVTTVEKGTEPRNVTEFRAELSKLEGFTEEQAEAVSNIFEHVIPRAIGESFDNVLKNRMLTARFGGVDRENPTARGAHFVEDGRKIIEVFKSADPSTVMHEMAHFVRKYLGPGDQATLNEFVGAKPGQEWTVPQEEQFAQAFERYHFDGGRRKGKLEKAFATIHRAMQAVYDAIVGSKLAKATPAVEKMFDRWYDWTRSERQPIAARVDVDALEASVKDAKVTIPPDAKFVDGTARVAPNGRVLVFMTRQEAEAFIDRNSKNIRTYGLYESKDKAAHYVKADTIGKKLFQPGVASLGDLARQAKNLEAQLKKTTDPREEARLRAMLNSIDNKMGGATLVFGGGGISPQAGETVQLVHGLSEMPSLNEPTSPAQAMTVRQTYGDPTEIELGGKHGRTERVPDAVPRNEPDAAERVPEPAGRSDRQHATTGQPLRGDGEGDRGGKRPVDPMSKVPAAALKAPERQRGTPVVDPAIWKEHAEELGLPPGTPPPTVRLPTDLRNIMIYPGQAEAIEVALSGLQQYDGVVFAAPTGSGKTWAAMAMADQLLGTEGNKVGLVITRSRNLIHDTDGYIDVGRKVGVEVEPFPKDTGGIAGGGVYAATYSRIRGDKAVLSVPWDFVIFDESAEGRKWMESEQGKSVVLLGHAAKKVVYMSATPFHTAVEAGYMHKLGMWPAGGFFEWARQFGVVETGPNSYSGGYAPKKLMKLRQQLIERGQWVSLHRDMDGVSAHVGMVKQTPEVRQGIKAIRTTFQQAAKIFTQQGKSAMARAAKAQEVVYLKRYIESARLPQALEAAEKAIANGWSPIIFSEYRSGSAEGMKFFDYLPPGVGDQLNKMLPILPNVVDAVREKLGEKAAIFAGSANELRTEEREDFMSGKKQSVYATYAAGGVGVGFHDKVGDRPRMGIFLGLPWSGIMFEQSLGRTWRYGTKSNVANLFMTSDTLPEMKLLATKILPRMRALNAAVYGEAVEGKLAKMLRESAGIHEDMVDYEMGAEDAPSAAQFEHSVEDKDIEMAQGPEIVHALKAKDARGEGKGMKYKTSVKKLYQEGKDQVGKDANESLDNLLREKSGITLSPQERWALLKARSSIRAEASAAAKDALDAQEPVKPEIERVTKDAAIGMKLALGERAAFFGHDVKTNTRNMKEFMQDWIRLRHTSGEQAIRKYMAEQGYPKEGRELQRKLIERSHLKGNYQGDLLSKVSDIIGDIRPSDHPVVVRVLEGKGTSDDPKVLAAVKGYQDFFAGVRKQLADAGATMKFYDQGGKEVTIGYNQIQDDPNYWPHIYDWNKPVLLPDGVHTLGEIHDMPAADARREKLIEQYAAKRGITKLEADKFFAKNRRGTRLAGNLEKGRRTSIPDYDETQKALGVYVNQVAEMLANIKTVGQYREKINPEIMSIPDLGTQKIVNSIVTSDLNPIGLGESNKRMLRIASQWTVLSKMAFSSLKLPFHSAKTSLVTNTRAMIGGLLSVATSPRQAVRMARDAGILTDYVKQAMMMEYGLHSGGLDQKMLTVTGFTPAIWLSRIISGASGRVFLERYAAPALAKDPNDKALRRKLTDLYGYSDVDLDRIAHKGYDASDVKRAMIAAADWTTGSGRPSELPPAIRTVDDHPITRQFNAFYRLTWQLKTFTFKTSNLVNRTVFEGLKQGPGWSDKEYKAVGRWLVNFGAAGLGLRMMQIGVNSVANPSAAEEEKRRVAAALENPKDALWLELGNVSYGMGLYPAKVLFDRLGTHDAGDLKKMSQSKRLENSIFEEGGGILASDFDHIGRGVFEWMDTFSDDGVNHRDDASERRSKIVNRVVGQTLVPYRMGEAVIGKLTGKTGDDSTAVATPAAPSRRARPVRRAARRGR